ncbi:MAG: hypothetical protein IAF94_03725 [Pirellulaceae bacterium]|nr:hypothetical protein [Pirellulaceae bacterium]
MRLQQLSGWRVLTVVIALLGSVLLMPGTASAVTPDDAKVKKCVASALKYLGGVADSRLGGDCLIGLCFHKAGAEDHPKITYAIKRCQEASTGAQNIIDNYSLGIALMFLCEVDPQNQHALIEKLVKEVLSRQQPGGGWSYPNYKTGDTSQTQYAVLGLFMAKNFGGVEVPIEKVEDACGWLMRTQDPTGGWGYQGVDAGSLVKVQQNLVSTTLSASGSGSMYMLADMLQVTKKVDLANAPKAKALQEIDVPGKKDPRAPLTVMLAPDDVKATLAAADRLMGTGFTPQVQWNHYYMYALERYHSFREKSGGARENAWYDQGFDYLSKTQKGDGSWDGQDSPLIATALATLFLVRSSQKTIVKQIKLQMGDGLAVAGMILPKDIKNIAVNKEGKVVDEGLVIPTEQILKLINDGPSEEVALLAEKREALELSSNKSERASQIESLRKIVGAGDFHARRIAVTTLSKVRDLDNVPKLLFALTDPDSAIVLQADKGLRFISRKVGGVGLPDGEPTTAQIQAAQAAWKDWYLSIRPNAELLD